MVITLAKDFKPDTMVYSLMIPPGLAQGMSTIVPGKVRRKSDFKILLLNSCNGSGYLIL